MLGVGLGEELNWALIVSWYYLSSIHARECGFHKISHNHV